ncbi:MAG: 16S rRNA (adenine(1518)-N(6)/adenine(1519)-N(6))-dimethyltransferase RsmA [Betaproteobacteria bacterium]|jgi:16S rRNA (adenine1518-N6/adenine1519-N6)-dimethyltransferase|nr:MAG: 16S rRNA (adenine(1518)-N(6)/adenine(1519)-N(6))-dimethyltransferase RsmA [Betaproteobacteria bacterium]
MRHRARRRFSQNFLIDRACIDRIVCSVAPCRRDRIVEIGPGLGALTGPLLAAVGCMDAIEVDRDVARELEVRFAGQCLSIHCVDFLEFDLASVGSELRLVGNLPYHISTPILFAVNQSRDCVRDCHFMLQREVVDRMVAEPASAAYGRLSVMLQCRWAIQKLFDVPPEAFRPQPKVWSSVVRMWPEQTVAMSDASLFYRIVEAAFSKRRKTLRNALRGLVTEQDLNACNLDPGRRGETLSVADFAELANQLDRRVTASSE